jgi:hypothetical protein
MDILIKLLGEQWLIGLVQLILGKLIKPALAERLLAAGLRATAFIPILNLIIAYLGFQLLPVSAAAAGFLAAAIPVKEGISVIGLALLQTVMVTGTHSTLKNTVVPVAKTGLKWLFSKLAPLVKKL